jgi:hypothetical protein
MSTIVKISDELKVLDKLIDKAHLEGEIPQYGPSGHSVIKETIGILKEEIDGIKPSNIPKE